MFGFRLLLVLMLVLQAGEGAAHPHVFIDNYVHFGFSADGLADVEVTWVFDPMFSATMRMDFDDGDGRLSAAETARIKAEAFDYLHNYGYFLQIRIDGEPFTVSAVEKFSAELKGRRLLYRFAFSCPVTAVEELRSVVLLVRDPTNYAAIMTRFSALSAGPRRPELFIDLSRQPAPAGLQLIAPDAVGEVTLRFARL